MYAKKKNEINIKTILTAVLAGTLLCTTSLYAAMIEGWGIVGDKLFQIGFDSDQANTAATRSLFATLPDSSVSSMALSPDGAYLYAVSGEGNTVYRIDVTTGDIADIGQVPTTFNLAGASTRGDEILMLDNGVLPVVWSLNMTDASSSMEVFRTGETTSIGGSASSMVNLNDDSILFFNNHHNHSSFRRRAWTLDNDGTTTLLGTVVDPLGNEVLGFNASDMAADGFVYAMDGGRKIWKIDYLGAQDGYVQAVQVDEFTPDGMASHGWSTVVFVPAAVVPVPAALWLFVSGVAGLAWVARRKKI